MAVILALAAFVIALKADIRAGEVIESDERLAKAIESLGEVVKKL